MVSFEEEGGFSAPRRVLSKPNFLRCARNFLFRLASGVNAETTTSFFFIGDSTSPCASTCVQLMVAGMEFCDNGDNG